MANYTKTTNFTAKDSLPSGNAAKKILGSLFDTEFNNISTAIGTKANLADTTFTGSTTLAQLTLASGASVTAILDEDNMASNSATAITTQQSTKAYVLSVVTDIGALLVTGTPVVNDFAKFTSAAEIVGRSYAETRADLSLEVGTDVQAYDADTAKLDVVQTFTTTQTWTKGADVASATELPLVTDGNYFDVTGTATATSFANLAVGTVVKLHFDGVMVLTNNTDIVCLSGANVTTAAGDEAEFVFFDTGKVRMTNYSRADGTPLVAPSGGPTLGSPVATTSGTSVNFTGIPSGVKRVTINISAVSNAANDVLLIQIGDSGGLETSGYNSVGILAFNTSIIAMVNPTNGYVIPLNSAAAALSGTMTLTLMDASTNTWVSSGNFGADSGGTQATSITGGTKSLSAVLDRVSLVAASGGAFDAGKINITYE